MRIFNSYLLVVATLLLLTAVTLIAFEQNDLGVYFTLFLIEALVVTELYVHLSTKARRGLNLVAVVLFTGFLGIVGLQVARILT